MEKINLKERDVLSMYQAMGATHLRHLLQLTEQQQSANR